MDASLGDGVLLSVQLAENHEWCVWQWCVCGRMYMGVCVCVCVHIQGVPAIGLSIL